MITQKVFKVAGVMKSSFGWQRFTKYVLAPNEKVALERIYSIIGSKHRLKRFQIKIQEIKPIENTEEIQDPIIRSFVEQKV